MWFWVCLALLLGSGAAFSQSRALRNYPAASETAEQEPETLTAPLETNATEPVLRSSERPVEVPISFNWAIDTGLDFIAVQQGLGLMADFGFSMILDHEWVLGLRVEVLFNNPEGETYGDLDINSRGFAYGGIFFGYLYRAHRYVTLEPTLLVGGGGTTTITDLENGNYDYHTDGNFVLITSFGVQIMPIEHFFIQFDVKFMYVYNSPYFNYDPDEWKGDGLGGSIVLGLMY